MRWPLAHQGFQYHFLPVAQSHWRLRYVALAYHKQVIGRRRAIAKQTMTFDNGGEFVQHFWLHKQGVNTYFCDAYSPWQKGAVENANARVRRWLPKSTDLASVKWTDICKLEDRLNKALENVWDTKLQSKRGMKISINGALDFRIYQKHFIH